MNEKQRKTKTSIGLGNARNSKNQKTELIVQNNSVIKDVFLTNEYCDLSIFSDEQEQLSLIHI